MIHWGIIGYGNIARRFRASLNNSQRGKLVAIASHSYTDKDEVKIYRDYLSLLEDEQVDAVYVALPHKDHAPISKLALHYGKAVLCEKPASLDLPSLKEVVALSQSKNLLYMEALKTRFIPAIDALKKLLKDVKIYIITASFCDNEVYRNDSYIYDPIQGGAIYDVASYPLGFCLDFVNSEVVDIQTEKNEFDMYFKTKLVLADGSYLIVEGAKDRSKPRVAIIECELGTIEVPMFNRPDSFLLNNKAFHYPLEGDDMSYEIEAFHDSYLKKEFQHYRMTHRDSLDIMGIIETMKREHYENQD